MQKLLNNIIGSIEKGDEISPFLFMDKNLEIANEKIKSFALELLQTLKIPSVYLFTFEDNGENIKVKNIREFTEKAHLNPPYPIQIFFIENISRFTLGAGNSLLKFLEEPGKQNLIFLSNSGENEVLETILSRVQTVSLGGNTQKKENLFFQDMIKNYKNGNNLELTSYFFKGKFTKEEYINFLENLIIFAKKYGVFVEYLDEILEDINLIGKNNVNAKFVADKWILKIGN